MLMKHESSLWTLLYRHLLQSPPKATHTLDFARFWCCYCDGKHLLLRVPADFSTIMLQDNLIYMFRMMQRVGSCFPSSCRFQTCRTAPAESWPWALERRNWGYKSPSWKCELGVLSEGSLTGGAREIFCWLVGWLFFLLPPPHPPFLPPLMFLCRKELLAQSSSNFSTKTKFP